MRDTGSRSSEITAGAVRRLLMIIQILERHPEGLSVPELMQRIECSRRSMYRYLQLLEDNGFPLTQPFRGKYSVTGTRSGEYSVTFTEAEARLLAKSLETIDTSSILKDSLIRKLRPIGGLSSWLPEPVHPQLAEFLNTIEKAISEKKKLLIHQYSSSRSGKIQDRIVEPYAILDHGIYVRAFDIGKGENRTFRISRMSGLTILDKAWKYAKYHEASTAPDMFGFTGSEWLHVHIVVSPRFVHLLREEFPDSGAQCFRLQNDLWRCEMQVKSWVGIGRFCMGLIEELYDVQPKTFQEYLQERIRGSNIFL